jgi:predicted transcriptional regulator
MAARPATEPREVVTCRIEGKLVEALDALAVADRRSRSEMVEQAVREYIERHPVKKSTAK